jgi:predicted nucleic acid-binding protein
MNGRVFVDTNVLVYAYDRSEPNKQRLALDVLDRLAVSGIGVISTQVLSEFFIAVTRKITIPMGAKDAYERIRNYLQAWTVVDLTGLIVLEAVRGTQTHQLSFWDAQIWAAARLNQISLVFSEDFASNSVIEGVRFVNPFSGDFSIDQWA